MCTCDAGKTISYLFTTFVVLFIYIFVDRAKRSALTRVAEILRYRNDRYIIIITRYIPLGELKRVSPLLFLLTVVRVLMQLGSLQSAKSGNLNSLKRYSQLEIGPLIIQPWAYVYDEKIKFKVDNP